MNTRELMDPAEARNVLLNAGSEDLARVDVRSVIIAGLSLDQEIRRMTSELESLRARTRSIGSANGFAAQVEGHSLVEGRDAGGLRHYLAERPVHAGDMLYLLTQLGWMPARYEWGYRTGTQCKLYVRLPGVHDAVAIHVLHGARLAWPDEINRLCENSRGS